MRVIRIDLVKTVYNLSDNVGVPDSRTFARLAYLIIVKFLEISRQPPSAEGGSARRKVGQTCANISILLISFLIYYFNHIS